MIERYDLEEGYCRKLGHHLAFSYCRRVNQGLPCVLARDCWYESFPVVEFLAGHYSDEELGWNPLAAWNPLAVSTPAPGKLETLLAILGRVRKEV